MKTDKENEWENLRSMCLATFKGVNKMSDEDFGKWCFDAGVKAERERVKSILESSEDSGTSGTDYWDKIFIGESKK